MGDKRVAYLNGRNRRQRLHPSPLLFLLPLLLAGCDLPGRPDESRRPVRPDQILDFKALFDQHCAGCHGADGLFGPAPPLHDRLFLTIIPDAELKRVITQGRPGTQMPAFGRDRGGPLTAEQVKVVITGMRSLWGTPPERRLVHVPEYLAGEKQGTKEAGAKLFTLACADCHGENGKGTAKIGPVNVPAFLALVSDQMLRRIVITGRPDLGMPDYEKDEMRDPDFNPLTSQDVSDLVALLASWRKTEAPPLKKQPPTAGPQRKGD